MRTLVLLCSALVAGAAEPASPAAIVELPPMIIEESSEVSWFYAQVGQTEYLSRCSPSLTREFIKAQTEAHQLLRLLVPDSFLAILDMPRVSLILPLETKRTGDDAVLREMLQAEEELHRRQLRADAGKRREPLANRYIFMPNLRLDDRDMTAVFSYVDERTFQGDRLIAAEDLLYHVLSRRTPMLPPWLMEGIISIYRQTKIRRDVITLPPLTGWSEEARALLQRDPYAPRTLLSAGELFSETVFRGEANQHEMRIATWHSQTALFFRWALDPKNAPAAAALWKFAEGASTRAVTEAWFIECFGFGYSDLRDRLSDYLPLALKEPLSIRPRKLPDAERFEIKPATRQQIARLRGECERLEIPYVRSRAPQFLDRYVEQARRTLRRSYERGDRDPRLIAALGLCEVDAGDDAAAKPWLEAAAAARVNRPRVYYECARLRWEASTRDVAPAQTLPMSAAVPTLEVLRTAMAGNPPLPEAYLLFADAWLRTEVAPPAGDLQLLADGARLFRRHTTLAARLALLYLRAGNRAAADATLATGLPYVGDEAMRTRFEQLRRAVQEVE
jgi:hypothetical protein